MIDRTQAPDLHLIDRLEIASPEIAYLDNGIPVYMFNSGKLDIAKIDFLFDAGSRYQKHPLTARFANKMLSEGTQSYTAFQIAEHMDYYGAYLGKMAFKDTSVVSISLLNKHLEQVLPVLAEIINQPIFPEKELLNLAKRGKQAFIDDQQKVSELAAMHFNQQVFGKNHSYGKLIEANDFDHLNTEYLRDFHQQYYLPDTCKIVVSGKLPETLLPLLNQHFGTNKSTPKSNSSFGNFSLDSGSKKEFISMPKSVQSAIRIGGISISKSHADYHKLFILNAILGGYFGSRLMKNIREDKGFTYGIYSALVSFQQSGMFFIITEVGSDVCHKAIDEIYGELKKLREEPVSLHEIDLVRKYLSGGILRSFDGPFQTSERFKNLLELNIDFKNYYANLINTLNTITPEQLLETAQNYLVEDTMFELVVGKKMES